MSNSKGKSLGLDKKRKFRTGGGVDDFGIQRAWGVIHFGISEGKGGLKYGSRPSLCTDIFWNCPMRVTKKYANKLTSKNPNWQEADHLAIYKAWWSWWLVGWLVVGWCVGWLVGWLVGGWVGGLVSGWLVGWLLVDWWLGRWVG